jgi:hypothetical protein
MLALQTAMALLVAAYYLWPAAQPVFTQVAAWQRAGGVLVAALASALAGGLLSETSAVYFLHGGRWMRERIDHALFKSGLFFISGGLVFEFYRLQAFWFGNGAAWTVLAPKVLVDQFGYSVIITTPLQSVLIRWHALGYSFQKLRRELTQRFVTQRMLPVLVTNWMFWLPAVTFVYSMPQDLQMPLCIFANAIWALLLSAAARLPNRAEAAVMASAFPQAE